MTATIEVRTRDLDVSNIGILDTPPQHAYIIQTMSDGTQYIMRAGPKEDGVLGMLCGNLTVDYVKYDENITGRAKDDYITDPSLYRSALIFDGDDNEVLTYMKRMQDYALQTNFKAPDYKLALRDLLFGNKNYSTDHAQQNSNSFVKQAIGQAELDFRFPIYPDGNEVFVPGIDSKIEDTDLDKKINDSFNLSNALMSSANAIITEYIKHALGIVDNHSNTIKELKKAFLKVKHADEISTKVADYMNWVGDAFPNVLEDYRKNYINFQNQANTECGIKKLLPTGYSFGPHNGEIMKLAIPMQTDIFGFIPSKDLTYYSCDKIQTPNYNVTKTYQNMLWDKNREVHRNFFLEGRKKVQQIDYWFLDLIKNFDTKDLPEAALSQIHDREITMMGELNALSDSYSAEIYKLAA